MVYDTPAVTQRCAPGSAGGDAIVVCGIRANDRYRIPRLPLEVTRLGKAEMELGGAKIGIATEQTMIGNFPSNRVMLKLKIGF